MSRDDRTFEWVLCLLFGLVVLGFVLAMLH